MDTELLWNKNLETSSDDCSDDYKDIVISPNLLRFEEQHDAFPLFQGST
jgi:hypothetical protein